MDLDEKQLLSLYYWVVDELPDSMTITLEYPSDNLVLPTVSVLGQDVDTFAYQMGSSEMNRLNWRVEVFANSRVQRDYLARILREGLKSHVPVYDYDEGFPPTVTPTRIGTMITSRIKSVPIHVFEDLVSKLYWRRFVSFSSTYESI